MYQFDSGKRCRNTNSEDPSMHGAEEMVEEIPSEKLTEIIKNVFATYMHSDTFMGRDAEPTSCQRHTKDGRLQ